jgi:hypothetical protein
MSAGACVVCDAPEPFGIGLCARCGPAQRRGDALVFADNHAGDRNRLRQLIGAAIETREGRAALRGRRALIQLPAPLAEQVAIHLSEGGVGARALQPGNVWTRMPPHFFLMVMLVLLLGSIAGAGALPIMTWTTPIFAALLGVAAEIGMRRPLLGGGPRRPGLSSEARAAAATAFSELGSGAAHSLLADIVRLSDGLRTADPALSHLDDLVTAAAATAREVARLETAYIVLHDRAAPNEIITRCESAHTNGTGLLKRAVLALGRISASGATDADSSAGQLGKLVHEMEVEAEARAFAARELEQLLKG